MFSKKNYEIQFIGIKILRGSRKYLIHPFIPDRQKHHLKYICSHVQQRCLRYKNALPNSSLVKHPLHDYASFTAYKNFIKRTKDVVSLLHLGRFTVHYFIMLNWIITHFLAAKSSSICQHVGLSVGWLVSLLVCPTRVSMCSNCDKTVLVCAA